MNLRRVHIGTSFLLILPQRLPPFRNLYFADFTLATSTKSLIPSTLSFVTTAFY